MARRRAGDSAVSDYRARIHYRLTVGVGRRRWAQVPASAVEEQVADVQWQRPNDLRVDVVGRRSRSRSEALELSSVWDRPWFVPRSVDDSVRIFSDEFPATGALHPLAESGPGVVPLCPDERPLGHAGERESTAASPGGGHPQADGARAHRRADVDRLRDRGSRAPHLPLRRDRALGQGRRAPRDPIHPRPSGSTPSPTRSSASMPISSTDFRTGRYWMPLPPGDLRPGADPRGERRGDPVPRRHDVRRVRDQHRPADRVRGCRSRPPTTPTRCGQSARPVATRSAPSAVAVRAGERDSLRSWRYADRWAGGRYELHRPSDDSLGRFGGWLDSLSLDADPVEARRARAVRVRAGSGGRSTARFVDRPRAHGFAYERLTDAFRYDRVQGLSLGLGYRVRVPGVSFTGLYGTVRYGFSDDRVTGRLSLVRDAPDGRLVVSGYRDVTDGGSLRAGAGPRKHAQRALRGAR